MPADDLFDQIMDRWDQQRQSGNALSAEELCKNCPELLPKVRQQIAAELEWEGMGAERMDDGPQLLRPVRQYTPIREVGRGGMGEVFLAHDKKLRRRVALKRMQQQLHGRPDKRRLFLREVKITARLQHPGVVPIYDLVREGQPWYAMRYIKGPTLLEAIDKFHGRQRAESDATALHPLLRRFVAVCQTIAYAHSRQIIHRDIKPQNIVLGQYAETLVLDWGLAKQLATKTADGSAKQPSAVTQESSPPHADPNAVTETVDLQTDGRGFTASGICTPDYASPEQKQGGDIGPASDIYSLGATLHHLLTRKPPSQGLSPKQVNRDIPPALDAICLKAMAPRTEDRYASAKDLAADVQAFMDDQPVKASREPWSVRARRWFKRHRTLATSGFATLAMLVLALGLLAAQQSRAIAREKEDENKLSKALDREKEAREQAERLLYFARIAVADREWQSGNAVRARHVLESCQPDLRGWEWRYLWRQQHTELFALDADFGGINCMSCSRDNRVLAAGLGDGNVAVWLQAAANAPYVRIAKDLHFNQDEKRPHASTRRLEVVSVAVSPDGRFVAAAARDSIMTIFSSKPPPPAVAVWKTTGERIWVLPLDASGLAIDNKGERLAVATGDTVEIRSLATGAIIERGMKHDRHVNCVAFSPDGKWLASGGFGSIVKVLNTNTGKEEFNFRTFSDVFSLAFNHSGHVLAAGCMEGRIDAWDLNSLRENDATQQNSFSLFAHAGTITSVAFSPDDLLLASAGGEENTVNLWKMNDRREFQTLRGHKHAVTSVLFSADSKRLLSGDQGNRINFWNAEERQDALCRAGHCIALSADGHLAAIARLATDSDKTVSLWDVESGEELCHFEGHKGKVRCAAFSPIGGLVATGGGEVFRTGEILLWEAKTGHIAASFESPSEIDCLAFSPDGKTLISTSRSNDFKKLPAKLIYWDMKSHGESFSVNIEQDVQSLVFSPDGRTLAVLLHDGTIRLLETQSGKELRALKGQNYSSVAYSKDGGLFVATGGNAIDGGKTWVWRTDSWELAYELTGHSKTVRSASFSRDGSRLAKSGEDGTLRLWDTQSREEILTLAHGEGVNAVYFGGDDVLVSSGGDFLKNGTTRIWIAKPQAVKQK